MKTTQSICLLLIVAILAGCSINISEATPPPTAAESTPTSLPAPTVTHSLAATEAPPPTAASTPTAAGTPLPWAEFNLAGRLVFTQGAQGIASLDLVSGELRTLYLPAENALVRAASVSPDGKQIVVALAPPPPAGQAQLSLTDLYLVPADGSAPPLPLLLRTQPQEVYSFPAWSPDGRYIYYGHFVTILTGGAPEFKYTLERLPYPGGQPEVIVENAFWPQLSPDGSKLAYVSFEPATQVNELYLAEADGTNPARMLPPAAFEAVDSPLFSPDGSALIFSAVGEGPPTALSWLDRLLGVRIARAHDVPSDFWSVATAGGVRKRLTRIQDIGLHGDFSPDGKYIAFLTVTGIFLMSPDGAGLFSLSDAGAAGTLEWIP